MQPLSIKLMIEIEKDSAKLGNLTSKIQDILFTDLSSSIDLENLQYKLKNCLSKFEGFDMLTITITKGEQFNPYPEIVESYRWTNRYNEFKRSLLVNGTYNQWNESNIKNIYACLKDMAYQANRLFIDTIRELNKVA